MRAISNSKGKYFKIISIPGNSCRAKLGCLISSAIWCKFWSSMSIEHLFSDNACNVKACYFIASSWSRSLSKYQVFGHLGLFLMDISEVCSLLVGSIEYVKVRDTVQLILREFSYKSRKFYSYDYPTKFICFYLSLFKLFISSPYVWNFCHSRRRTQLI